MAHTRRRLAGAAMAGTTLGAALMIGVPIASAAAHAPPDAARLRACSGTGCDDKDPVVTGCARGAHPVASKNTGKGRFELYWSATCQTNWVQVNNYAGGGDYLRFRTSDMDRPHYGHVFTASTKAGRHYGDMVFSPGHNCAEGHADWISNGHDEVVIKSSGC